jgi:hypothetical protein
MRKVLEVRLGQHKIARRRERRKQPTVPARRESHQHLPDQERRPLAEGFEPVTVATIRAERSDCKK